MSLSQVLLSRCKEVFLSRTIACSTSRIIQHRNTFATAADEKKDDGEPSTETDPSAKKRNPEKDRSIPVPYETSVRYLESKAYKDTYGDLAVWVPYRRNFKGQFAPKKTRRTCIRQKELTTGNPCPICRDEYLVLDYRNTELIKQFISPFNGATLGFDKTGICRKQHFNLLLAIEQAKDHGTITYDVPFRDYNNYDYKSLVVKSSDSSDKDNVKE